MRAETMVLAGLLAGLAGCDGGPSAHDTPAPTLSVAVQGWPPPSVHARARAARDAATRDAGPADASPEAVSEYAVAPPVSGNSIGHTSVVFKLKLEGGLEAAYKPRSKRGPTRYKGELAAYRLATALGLPNVPTAIPRSFPRAVLLKALGGETADAGALLAREAIADAAGNIQGALIPWIPHLELLAIEKDPLLAEWHSWLDGAADVPDDKRDLAAQISTLIVFDYMTGNWDRWSGGNVGFDESTRTVLFIDNDGAFYDVPPAGPLARQKGRLGAITRFSRGFVARLRALDAKSLASALGDETPGVPLLTDRAIDGVNRRRDEALAIIDARIKKAGPAKALAFE